jgi:uncharacterized membrane protein
MTKYNKFIVALIGAIVTGLTTFGVVGDAQGQQITAALSTLTTAAITAIAVWVAPNH